MRRGQRRALVAVVSALAAAGVGALASPDPPSLSPGTAVERGFAAGDAQLFDVELAAGRSYRLAVEQRGIHLVVDVRAADGGSLAAVDSPLDRWGMEAVLLRPAATGVYRVEV